MYIAMDRKPEDGCELQTASCGRTGVMLQLKVVKTMQEEAELQEEEGNNNNGLKQVMIQLTQPWESTGWLIFADSYFASVKAAIELKRRGFRFIGVIKTATRHFPKALLENKELSGRRRDQYGVHAKDVHGNPELMAYVWVDKDRRYFLSSCSSMADGTPIKRERWRQTTRDRSTRPVLVHITIPQPQATQIYYEVCGKIDRLTNTIVIVKTHFVLSVALKHTTGVYEFTCQYWVYALMHC
jgi:Transposase IS4